MFRYQKRHVALHVTPPAPDGVECHAFQQCGKHPPGPEIREGSPSDSIPSYSSRRPDRNRYEAASRRPRRVRPLQLTGTLAKIPRALLLSVCLNASFGGTGRHCVLYRTPAEANTYLGKQVPR